MTPAATTAAPAPSDGAIGLGEAARIYARMTWLRMRRGRVVWLAAALFALPLVYVAGLAIA
ncbi:MAG TPA: hypothetical protein VF997_25120, partial [Polyangia bacterium]